MKLGEAPSEFLVLGTRDAVHTAIVLARTTRALRPGATVKFVNPCDVVECELRERHGIIDPFTPHYVIGKTWVLIDPKYVLSLKHVFTVPEIPFLCEGDEEEEDYFGCPPGCG